MSSDLKNWRMLLASFFARRRKAILEVYGASRVREYWLQGEAYRHFNRLPGVSVGVNVTRLEKGETADLTFFEGERPRIVAEIKVFGVCGYYPKNLTGNSDISFFVRAVERNGTFSFRDCIAHRRFLNPSEGSLLKDFFRLRRFSRATPGVRTVLLCVLDKRVPRNGDADRFGKVITRVHFGSPAIPLVDDEKLLVNAWDVSAA